MIKKFADIILQSNIFVALCFTALTFQTFFLFEITASPLPLCLFVFLSTLITYNFHRWYKNNRMPQSDNEPARIRWHRENKKAIEYFLIVCFLLLGLSIVYYQLFNLKAMVLLSVFGVISGLYTIPIIPYHQKKIRLRDIPFSKVIWVSLVVTGVSVLLPVAFYPVALEQKNVVLYFLSGFMFIAAITIPFNIRDTLIDKSEGLKTIPAILGRTRAKVISLLLMGVYLIAITLFYIEVRSINSHTLILLYIIALVTVIIIRNADEDKSEYYYGYLLECTPFLNCIVVMIGFYY